MAVMEIASASAPEVQMFFGMTDAQLRSRQRPEESMLIAEGPKVVRTALESGLKPVAMLMRKKMVNTSGADLVRLAGSTPVYTAEDDTLAALTGFRLQRAWVLCAFPRPAQTPLSSCLHGARRVAFLEGLNEPSSLPPALDTLRTRGGGGGPAGRGIPDAGLCPAGAVRESGR